MIWTQVAAMTEIAASPAILLQQLQRGCTRVRDKDDGRLPRGAEGSLALRGCGSREQLSAARRGSLGLQFDTRVGGEHASELHTKQHVIPESELRPVQLYTREKKAVKQRSAQSMPFPRPSVHSEMSRVQCLQTGHFWPPRQDSGCSTGELPTAGRRQWPSS